MVAWHPNGWKPVGRSFEQARAGNKLRRIIRCSLISRRFSPHPLLHHRLRR